MDLQLKGRKAIVTGASKGIGLCIAQTLAGEGVDVAICARTAADVEKAAAGLRSQGVKVEILQDATCIQLMRDFIKARPELWNEDIGV